VLIKSINRESINSLLSMEPDELTDSQKLRFSRPLRLNLPNSQEFGGFISNDMDFEQLASASPLEDITTSQQPSILKSEVPSSSLTQKRVKVKKPGKEKIKEKAPESERSKHPRSPVESLEEGSEITSILKDSNIINYDILVDPRSTSSTSENQNQIQDKSEITECPSH
jgi:hypothetical protein